MRLSEWRRTERGQKLLTGRVASALGPALAGLGTADDPEAFVVWGDDPQTRFTVMAAADAGLALIHVRVNVPQEGPRASGKLIRWQRVTLNDLTAEAHHDHRYVTIQIENSILQGVDADADAISDWARHVFARIDGRVSPEPAGSDGGAGTGARSTTRRGGSATKRAVSATKARAAAGRGPAAGSP
jgi:hypothetical protein